MRTPYYVYIISDKTHSVLQTVLTSDLKKSVIEVKDGVSEFLYSNTKNLSKLLWVQSFNHADDAIKAESDIKHLPREQKVSMIRMLNPQMKNLLS